jgi:hypothetical protein
MNTSQLSERESVANPPLQIHSRREPSLAPGAQSPARELSDDTATKTEVGTPAQPTTTEIPEPVREGSNLGASRTFHPGPERFDTRPDSCEVEAREALDLRAGRTLTDADWAAAKDRLLEFFTILREWDRKTRAVSRDLVMYEVPCLPEL